MKEQTHTVMFALRRQLHACMWKSFQEPKQLYRAGQASDEIMAPNKHLQKYCIYQRPGKSQIALGAPREHVRVTEGQIFSYQFANENRVMGVADNTDDTQFKTQYYPIPHHVEDQCFVTLGSLSPLAWSSRGQERFPSFGMKARDEQLP